MTERFKDFLARHVFHPMQGMALGEWWELLGRHRFAVDLPHLHRALIQTALSASNSVNARIERARFGRRVEAARIEAPLVILGHYRSGTTHLHNLLALDPQFSAPNFYEALNPHTFLSKETWLAPFVDRLIVHHRFQDEMALGAGVPSEDEIAMCTMTGLSPYMGWCFPADEPIYARYLTFRDAEEGERERWKSALTLFFKKLTLKQGRPLALKSPPHTARVRLLFEPLAVIASIYDSLGLEGFSELQPRIEHYLGTITGYRKNRHEELPEELRTRIAHEWGRSFDEWGYSR